MDDKGALSLIGLAARAGKLVYGQAQCMTAVRNERISLLLLDGSVSARTLKSFADACKAHNIPWIHLAKRNDLGAAVGKPGCRLVGVTDAGFARSVNRKLETDPERERIEQNQDIGDNKESASDGQIHL